MKDEKLINEIIDYVKYNKISVFDAILEISEDRNLDVEDIVKSLDENLLYELKSVCLKERKVLLKEETIKYDIESLFT